MTGNDRQTLEQLTRAFTETFNDNDLDAMMSYFAEDGAVYDQHDGTLAEGLTAIRTAFQPQFDGEYGAMSFTAEDLFIDPEQGKAMISWLCSFDTKRGRAGWRGLDILHFNDAGKITTKLTYAKAKVLQLDAVDGQ
ncbi:MAG: nuclear transport factor 2 family protein [Alphaproteobacteria bacterium]|jgi:ketosteroid isomerase-like protein|nr:nuclear transport factor 2 family protein [Alphaproteobacteria bacterium]MDP6874295.1 nuclear transport factor 2 family protein [Alphaproteobacteria bacterium]